MTLPLLSQATVTTRLISVGANAGIQYFANSSVDLNDIVFAYWTSVLTADTCLWAQYSGLWTLDSGLWTIGLAQAM